MILARFREGGSSGGGSRESGGGSSGVGMKASGCVGGGFKGLPSDGSGLKVGDDGLPAGLLAVSGSVSVVGVVGRGVARGVAGGVFDSPDLFLLGKVAPVPAGLLGLLAVSGSVRGVARGVAGGVVFDSECVSVLIGGGF